MDQDFELENPGGNEYRIPAMRTAVPCNENWFFPVRINYTGKTLFWPCTDPVRDFSVYKTRFEILTLRILFYFSWKMYVQCF